MSYGQCMRELDALQDRGMYRGLDRMQEACRLLGHPEKKFSSVHIAGTNGKGSTAVFLAEILRQSGLKTGLTLSPHVSDFRERIQLNNRWISEDEYLAIHTFFQKKISHLPLTYYEWAILVAFTYFARHQVDMAVIETGMGGRWDATNVILPKVGILTNVGYDHQQILGSSLAEILLEKLQILKPGMVAWTGIADPELFGILEQHCARHHIPLQQPRPQPRGGNNSFSLFDYPELQCGLLGKHQMMNASLAIGAAESLLSLGFPVDRTKVPNALLKAFIPGRLEWISRHPPILLDGAHNLPGIEALCRYLKNQDLRFHLVFGCLRDRPFRQMVAGLVPYCSKITGVCFDKSRGFDEGETREQMQPFKQCSESVLDISEESWQELLRNNAPHTPVLVTGSLYLLAKIRSYFFKTGEDFNNDKKN